MDKWDKYFHDVCETISSKSPCLSRKIGAILVKDRSIVSTGYNGPPRLIPHCGHSRWIKDKMLNKVFESKSVYKQGNLTRLIPTTCPRRILGYESGTHMEMCPAQHAEENAVTNAARLGVPCYLSTLYMNSIIPCQKCYGTLINAGIVEIVVDNATIYDEWSEFIIENSNIKIREFDI